MGVSPIEVKPASQICWGTTARKGALPTSCLVILGGADRFSAIAKSSRRSFGPPHRPTKGSSLVDSSPPNSPTFFFLRLLESTAQPFVAVDTQYRFVLTNPAFEKLIGYCFDELREMTVIDLTPGHWRDAHLRHIERLQKEGRSVRFEKEYCRKDGSVVPVEVVFDVDRDEEGEIRNYFAFVTDITDRKAVENALKNSEKRFRELYDEAPFGYHEIDIEGRIVSINRTEAKLLGYAREEMLGRPIFDFVAEELRETARIAVREKMAGVRPLSTIERPYLTKDGRRLIVSIEEGYRLDSENRVIGLRSTVQDVSTKAQTERALVASERRARALFEGIEDVIFVHDYDGKILDANPAASRRLGYTREELLQMNTRDIDAPGFADGFGDRLEQQLEQGHTRFDGRHRAKDGREIPVEISTSKIRLEETDAILGVSRDISERIALETARRRLAEAELDNAQALASKNQDLSRSEARYRMLTEGSHDAVVVADRDGNITLFNPAAERTFGYASSEMTGQPISSLMPEALRGAHHAGLDRYVATRVPKVVGRTVELTGLRKNGETFPLELSLSAVESGGELQFIGSIRDQTERQRMRAMLVQSEKLASIGLLSAGVAHEINNPLAYVANNLAVLERDLKGVLSLVACYESIEPKLRAIEPEVIREVDEVSEDLDWPYVRTNLPRMLTRTREGVQRVANIVQNLRGLARTSPPKMEPALLVDLIAPALEMIQGRIRRRGVEIIQNHENPRRVACVASQISQVVLNLLVNAIQAIESNSEHGGKILVSSCPGSDYYRLEISDDGPGIDPDSLSRLFDPFFTTKPVGEGTGLGLSISHGIVTGHGGRIEVESQVGVGTTFRIFLPLAAAAS